MLLVLGESGDLGEGGKEEGERVGKEERQGEGLAGSELPALPSPGSSCGQRGPPLTPHHPPPL